MKKLLSIAFALLISLCATTSVYAREKHSTQRATVATTGKVTLKTVGAGALSLLVWPGIGQMVNNDKGEKVGAHALLGLTGVFRFWSCYDAVVDRQGGYWEGRI